jgi:hypothetical protein
MIHDWIRIRARYNGHCRECRLGISIGDKTYFLPKDRSKTGKGITVCPKCMKEKNLDKHHKLSAESTGEKPESSTLGDLVKGVRSNYPEDPKEGDALDKIMNEAFEDQEKKIDPYQKETEKYSLAWFATWAKWQMG